MMPLPGERHPGHGEGMTITSAQEATMSRTSITGRQKGGLVLAALISASNIPSVFSPTPDGKEGPPFAVLLVGAILGVVGLVAVVLAWRGNRAALRVCAGALIVNLLLTLPAFFVDVPSWIKATSALIALLTVAALVLMFSTSRRPVPVTD
jgi:CHASE2 domain-containing sensor protein